MSKINVRSPYFITDNSTNSGSALASATLYIRIYTGAASTNLGQDTRIHDKFYCHKRLCYF